MKEICDRCRPVRIHGESGHRGDYHDAVKLCPLHAQAVATLGRLVRAFDPPSDRDNARMVVESSWFQKNLKDARAILLAVGATS